MIQNAATDVTTGWREIALDVLTTCVEIELGGRDGLV